MNWNLIKAKILRAVMREVLFQELKLSQKISSLIENTKSGNQSNRSSRHELKHHHYWQTKISDKTIRKIRVRQSTVFTKTLSLNMKIEILISSLKKHSKRIAELKASFYDKVVFNTAILRWDVSVQLYWNL